MLVCRRRPDGRPVGCPTLPDKSIFGHEKYFLTPNRVSVLTDVTLRLSVSPPVPRVDWVFVLFDTVRSRRPWGQVPSVLPSVWCRVVSPPFSGQTDETKQTGIFSCSGECGRGNLRGFDVGSRTSWSGRVCETSKDPKVKVDTESGKIKDLPLRRSYTKSLKLLNNGSPQSYYD